MSVPPLSTGWRFSTSLINDGEGEEKTMVKLGGLTVEELADGAVRDATYLAERLEKLARERGADRNHMRRSSPAPS
ncbi:hypothetical protein AB0A91_33850 [Streptomyces sp. NPDC042207]|uniref:hypothetical protein n=1 Tax=Streptomyces sp. NPDC042207 TaxID=3154331 RepID=UPI0033F80F3E